MNNNHEIISLHDTLPLEYKGIISKISFSLRKKYFGQKIYGEIILNGKTNDQILLRWGRSFINNKCLFH